MPSFAGRYQYLDEKSSPLQAGSCRLSCSDETLTLIPEKGAALALDLGDIDVFTPGDYEIRLKLFTGRTILLTHFGKEFQNLSQQLLNAFRCRLVQCLLLEDLEELCRMDGFAQLDSPERAFSGHSEIRLYKSNIAVLPLAATGMQWRLADIDAMDFDEATYTLGLRSGNERLILTRMAKRTTEFRERLGTALGDLSGKGAQILHSLFPFLTPDQFQKVAELMKEGHAAPVSGLKAIHGNIERAVIQNAVDKQLKPYFQHLRSLATDEGLYAGFKVIREESVESGTAETKGHSDGEDEPESLESTADSNQLESGVGAEKPDDDRSREEGKDILHFFFFVLRSRERADLASNIVAWEASSRSGRATYFFRMLSPEQTGLLIDPAKAPRAIDSSIRQLNRALGLLNFRREPVYIPDASLETQPHYRRYAIACRKMPVLQQLRACFIGRAIHTNLQVWQKQVESLRSSVGER